MTTENTVEMLELTGRFQLKENIDLNRRVIQLNVSISVKNTDKFLRSLSFLESISLDPITIIVNTSGGDVYSGFAIIDAIQSSPCQITTIGTGLVASMGVPILASGNIRKGTNNATFMFHEISYGFPLERLTTGEVEAKHSKALNSKINKFMAAHTDKPYHFWSRIGKHLDYYFDTEKAIELGIIDEVCEGV